MKKTRLLALGGIMAALVAAFTNIQVPLPSNHGYLNLGDAMIFASAFILPEYLYCAAAAGIGSALVDLVIFPIYAPATFIIKAMLALFAVIGVKKTNRTPITILSFMLAALIVPVGYFIYECILYGVGIGAANILFNLLQSEVGAIVGGLLGIYIRKIRNRQESK